MALAIPGSLYFGSVVVGACYGVRLAITVPIASELFGLKYYGLLYNILILNFPLGSFLFSGLLAGLLYDAEATPTPDGGNTCVGAHCYRLVFTWHLHPSLELVLTSGLRSELRRFIPRFMGARRLRDLVVVLDEKIVFKLDSFWVKSFLGTLVRLVYVDYISLPLNGMFVHFHFRSVCVKTSCMVQNFR